jgi:hypothetical protein
MRAALVIVSFLLALEIGSRIRNPFPFRVRGDHIVLPAHQTYTISHLGAIKLDPVRWRPARRRHRVLAAATLARAGNTLLADDRLVGDGDLERGA